MSYKFNIAFAWLAAYKFPQTTTDQLIHLSTRVLV